VLLLLRLHGESVYSSFNFTCFRAAETSLKSPCRFNRLPCFAAAGFWARETATSLGRAGHHQKTFPPDQFIGLRTGKCQHRQEDGNFDRPSAMAISPDGSNVAITVSHATGVFKVGHLTEEYQNLEPLVTIPGDATALGFSPKGDLLVLRSIDGTVRVVKVPSGDEWAVVNAGVAVTAVVITNDGRFAAADIWGRARVWNASIDSMRKRLCDSLGSNLSVTDWKRDQYLNVQPPQTTCENWPGR
jgi:WD40 repeat protein